MKKLQNKVSFYHAQILLEGIKTGKDKKTDPSGDYDYLVHVRYGGSVNGETEFNQRIRFDDYSPVPIDEAALRPF